ncbi:four helix bundle protein [Aliarcobacter cryaerophilus]|uniref:four helix bundle protein n=1 Tax=Aliarcobacter cryaerophilus TaxID=28198 RepID=UPI0021B27D90|nr:four helix bundle protein [Aliarcobacter cryaerophilus]MCT7512606.1 four helix bundle protein [Aliarcobacter cryaerophilus]
MSGKVIVLDKSFDFAVRVVNLYKYLFNDKKEFTLSKQLLRSGTSIGANINEAQAGQSKADFISKMSIASKEARETKYWIELLIKTDYLNIKEDYVKSLLNEIDELIKIITSIVKTSKENSR